MFLLNLGPNAANKLRGMTDNYKYILYILPKFNVQYSLIIYLKESINYYFYLVPIFRLKVLISWHIAA